MNWREQKPHRMLGLSKEDFRTAMESHWSTEIIGSFRKYKKLFPKVTAEEFGEYGKKLGWKNIMQIQGIWEEGLPRITRYLTKQETRENNRENPDLRNIFSLFRDYRDMMLERNMVAELGELTEVEKYPPDLRRAHDRIARENNARMREMEARRQESRLSANAAQYAEKFTELAESFRGLEYSDGEICIVIPRSPVDLIREGHVLNHCVGGYSQKHCSGMPIFFVRHARRPERSWYTLNEDLTGENASRIQLHGYCNELAHGRRLTIPKKVMDFVDKWEREILAPWFEKQKNQNVKKTGKDTAA